MRSHSHLLAQIHCLRERASGADLSVSGMSARTSLLVFWCSQCPRTPLAARAHLVVASTLLTHSPFDENSGTDVNVFSILSIIESTGELLLNFMIDGGIFRRLMSSIARFTTNMELSLLALYLFDVFASFVDANEVAEYSKCDLI